MRIPTVRATRRKLVAAMVVAGAVAACSSVPDEEGSSADQSLAVDPLAQPALDPDALTDVSADLDAVLERGQLAGACARYAGGARDRRTTLLCGKSMFFDEGFGTAGVPRPIVSFILDNFEADVGQGFSRLGMIADPRSRERMPLGMAPGGKLGWMDTVAFTCASCHFGKLPDGRFAVGAPNHAYEYGRHNLVLATFPLVSALGPLGGSHAPEALAAIKPLTDRVDRDLGLRLRLYGSLVPILTTGAQVPRMGEEVERAYASWKPGTMDFFIAPLPFDDGIHTVSKISPLWSLPTDGEVRTSGMHHAMLGWTGGTASLANFVEAFVHLGGGDLRSWPADRLRPLVEYIYTLRAPSTPAPPSSTLVAEGARAFTSKGCTDCHDGPRGSGTRVFDFSEVGTDDAMRGWADPDLDGVGDGNITFRPGDEITHGIKAPRLVGTWAMSRFLHNGALDSLEQLFCLTPRPGTTQRAFADRGHTMTCEGLTIRERRALVAYLRAH